MGFQMVVTRAVLMDDKWAFVRAVQLADTTAGMMDDTMAAMMAA